MARAPEKSGALVVSKILQNDILIKTGRAFRSRIRRMDSILDAPEAEWKKKEMENEGEFIGQHGGIL